MVMSGCKNVCNSDLRSFLLPRCVFYTMMQAAFMYDVGGFVPSACLYAHLHGQRKQCFSLSAPHFSSSQLISVPLVAPQP